MPHLPGRGSAHARGRLERTGGVRGLQRAHTVYVEYEDEDEKAEAERKVIHLWNIGKVITSERGE